MGGLCAALCFLITVDDTPPKVELEEGRSDHAAKPVAAARESNSYGLRISSESVAVQVSGAIHIKNEPGARGRPYLGDGVLYVAPKDGGPAITAEVVDGRFSLIVAPDFMGYVKEVMLGGHRARVLEGQGLVANQDNLVSCWWERFEVRLFVQDRDSGRPLPRVTLWSAETAWAQSDGFGIHTLGPALGTDVALCAETPSPLLLQIGTENTPQVYWVAHEGYVPALYRFPSVLPKHEVMIDLEPCGTIEMDVHASELAALRVQLYKRAANPDRPVGEPLRIHRAMPSLGMSELPAGEYVVSLEDDTSVLDWRAVDLEAGTVEWITLTAKDEAASRKGYVSFCFADDVNLHSLDLEVRPLSLEVRSRQSQTPTVYGVSAEDDPSCWDGLELPPGQYLLRVGSTGQVLRFGVDPGMARRFDIPPQMPGEPHFITFLDEDSGAFVPLRSLSWSMPMTLDGRPDRENMVGGFDVDDPLRQPVQIVAPAGLVLLQAITDGYGPFTGFVDLSKEADPILSMRPLACLRIVPGGIDQDLTTTWLEGIRVRQETGELRPEAVEVHLRGGIAEGRAYFSAHGATTVEFPGLSSYGRVPATSLTLLRGESSTVLLSDLIALDR